MKRLIFTIAAAASAATVAAPAHADIRSGELNKAYLKGKQQSKFGRQSVADKLLCFQLYNLWAKMTTSYHHNFATANGELGNGYTNLQFYHYAKRWGEITQQPGLNWQEPWLAIMEEMQKTNWEKEKNQRKLGTMLGECAVPRDQVSVLEQDFGRADSFLERNLNQPWQETYPKWVKDRVAWDAYAKAWRAGHVDIAAKIVIASHEKGDTKTFHENEFLLSAGRLVELGHADQLDQKSKVRLAYLDPDRFASLAGMNAADFRARVVPVTASVTQRGGGLGTQNRAEGAARNKCDRQGGRTLRVSSRIVTSSVSPTSGGYSTYEATAQCEFKPKIGR